MSLDDKTIHACLAALPAKYTEDQGIDAEMASHNDTVDQARKAIEGLLTPLYCDFCGKSQHDVTKLIAGPKVFICNECVELCNDIIREETAAEKPSNPNDLGNEHG